jgi:hypothetical protein
LKAEAVPHYGNFPYKNVVMTSLIILIVDVGESMRTGNGRKFRAALAIARNVLSGASASGASVSILLAGVESDANALGKEGVYDVYFTPSSQSSSMGEALPPFRVPASSDADGIFGDSGTAAETSCMATDLWFAFSVAVVNAETAGNAGMLPPQHVPRLPGDVRVVLVSDLTSRVPDKSMKKAAAVSQVCVDMGLQLEIALVRDDKEELLAIERDIDASLGLVTAPREDDDEESERIAETAASSSAAPAGSAPAELGASDAQEMEWQRLESIDDDENPSAPKKAKDSMGTLFAGGTDTAVPRAARPPVNDAKAKELMRLMSSGMGTTAAECAAAADAAATSATVVRACDFFASLADISPLVVSRVLTARTALALFSPPPVARNSQKVVSRALARQGWEIL